MVELEPGKIKSNIIVIYKEKKIHKLLYPGLKSHPQFELAKSQMTGFGGIISIDEIYVF